MPQPPITPEQLAALPPEFRESLEAVIQSLTAAVQAHFARHPTPSLLAGV